jgi:SnoaL-like domain
MPESRFRGAVESKDLDALLASLSPDVVFRSPVVYKPYEGREAVGMVLAAVLEVFEDFRYVAEVSQGDREVLVFETRVGERELQGVDIIRLGHDGLVAELIVMVRPMSGMHALAEAMRQKLEAASPPA